MFCMDRYKLMKTFYCISQSITIMEYHEEGDAIYFLVSGGGFEKGN